MHPLFDSHAHYDDHRFDEEFEGGTHGALMKAYEEGVHRIVNVGSSLAHSEASAALAEKYDFVYAAVGLHPSDIGDIPESDLEAVIGKIEKLAAHPKVRAIGEIGFDYYWDTSYKDKQKLFFDAQLTLSEKLGLPAIIHARDAAGDTFDMIRSHPKAWGVLHSYSGTAEMARQLCDLGWYISFSGPVTYKNANKVKEAAAVVPSDRIMIETDCPYLPPVPHRGKINYSGYMKHTCETVAEIRGTTPDEMARITYENACRFFGLDK